MKTLGDVFDDQCRRAPDVPAVVSGATRLTFADLHRWSAQLSLTMAPHVSPGQRVALLLPVEAAFAAAAVAATRVAGVVAPLDTASPVPELTAQLAELDPAALVTDADGVASAIAATSDLSQPPALVLLHAGEADVIERRATPARALSSDDSPPLLQLVAHSPGHRGRVVRSHARVLAEWKALRDALDIEAGDRILGCSGFHSTLFAALCAGVTFYAGQTLPPREVLALLEREDITVLEGVSPLFATLADLPGRGKNDLRSLRVVVSSREPVAEAEASAFHRRFGLSLRQVYGSAVTGAISVNGEPGAGTAPGSIGRPLRGVRVKVVAGGAIAVASPFAATEFLDDPAATAAMFRDGYFLSGDVGAKASGGTIAITGWLS